jgi:hypothetical protein
VRITGVPELVHCRVRAERTVHRADDAALPAGDRRAATPSGSRPAWFDATGQVEVPTYDWTALTPGLEFTGPAVIDGPDSSLVVPPDAVCACDPHGNLVVDLAAMLLEEASYPRDSLGAGARWRRSWVWRKPPTSWTGRRAVGRSW